MERDIKELLKTYDELEQYKSLMKKVIEQDKRINKAIEYIEKALKDDYSEFMYMSEPKDILDILRGEDNEE